jgi:hypothetical protein
MDSGDYSGELCIGSRVFGTFTETGGTITVESVLGVNRRQYRLSAGELVAGRQVANYQWVL